MSTITRSDRRSRALALALALSSSVLGVATPARAQEAPSPAPPPSAAPDPLGPLRERFKEGMDRYRAGAFGDAAVIWEAIYRELGPDTGYRLAFNLGRAYDQLGDLIKAAEHYETYLAAVSSKRAAGVTLEANVERQEIEARERLDVIASKKGRIKVAAGASPVVTRIDNAPPRMSGFLVYVEPGSHVVRFAGERDEVREVAVQAGELVELAPPAPVVRAPIAPPPAPRFESRIERPFGTGVIWIAGAVTLASVAIPAITYSSAFGVKDDFEAARAAGDYPEQLRLEADYNSARSNAYASLAVPSILALATGGLVVWYYLGARRVDVPIAPTAGATAGGASLGAVGTF
ncbi:MAG: hypothetical protein JST00_04835 [Deltaproteobacteria bacterium]|nr:hypothetical protein [Deltaproteobacteria bacterium]